MPDSPLPAKLYRMPLPAKGLIIVGIGWAIVCIILLFVQRKKSFGVKVLYALANSVMTGVLIGGLYTLKDMTLFNPMLLCVGFFSEAGILDYYFAVPFFPVCPQPVRIRSWLSPKDHTQTVHPLFARALQGSYLKIFLKRTWVFSWGNRSGIKYC